MTGATSNCWACGARIMQSVKSWQRIGLALFCFLAGTVSCGPKARPERWIIPENYTGWLRLDYGVAGASPLPLENEFSVVRMPQSGRLQTSSPYSSSIDQNEFLVI